MRPYHTKHLKHIKPDVSALRFSYSKCVEQCIMHTLISNLVCTTCLRNNLPQIRPQPKK